MYSECAQCKRQYQHGGKCMEQITGPCLAFEQDPRGRLLSGRENLIYDLSENIEVKKWTENRWDTDQGPRNRYITGINKIFWSEKEETWVIQVDSQYWEHGDAEEDREYELQRELIKKGIHNVVLMHKKQKRKGKW